MAHLVLNERRARARDRIISAITAPEEFRSAQLSNVFWDAAQDEVAFDLDDISDLLAPQLAAMYEEYGFSD